MNLKMRGEMLGKTEDEIRSEMASALGRIGRTFEDLLAQLSKQDAASEKYPELLKEARLYYWYLIVQRESIGLRNHEQVIREYKVPPEVLQRR